MENTFLIDLSVKYALNVSELSKVKDMAYQAGFSDPDSKGFQLVATYLCENKLVERPAEEIMEELRREGLAK